MAQEFKNQIVVITGGASGIGFAAARAFAQAGAVIIVVGRNSTKLKAAQKRIGKHCEVYSADVAKAQSIGRVLSSIYKKHGKIDVLVNCAGIYGPIGQFHSNNLKNWAEAISVNLLGTVNACHAVLPLMVKKHHGKIINLSGGGAVQPFPNFSAYATSKAAVVRFTENLAKEYEKQNIQINAIAPGAINTKFLQQVLKAGVKSAGKDFYSKSLEQKRTGGDSVEAAAELILFLCSQKSAKLTGKIISAKWDSWQKWNSSALSKVNKSSQYTLRRIDNKYFYEK